MGSFSNVSLSYAAGSTSLSLAVPSRVWMAATRWSARSESANNQFFLPMAIGRKVFYTALLSMGKWPTVAWAQWRPTFQHIAHGFGGTATVRGVDADVGEPLMQWYGVHKRRYNRLNLNIDQARKNMQIARMKETPPANGM